MKKMYRQWLGIAALLCHITMQAAGNKAVVTGTVKDTQGNPIAGVVVTDGKHVTATDRQGIYMLDTDPFRQPMVYISTPADYVLPEKEGVADGFYHYQDTSKVENQCDFVLQKRDKKTDEFVFIPISDPQVKNEKQLARFRSETVPDLVHTVDSLNAPEVIGMQLGDLVWDAMNLYTPYRATISDLGLTMFQLMGNHDFNLLYADMERTAEPEKGYGEKNYYEMFGPTDYSFNVGKVHIIAMKDIDYEGGKKYTERFTEEQLEWLKKDLT